jgi:hypothetical protein
MFKGEQMAPTVSSDHPMSIFVQIDIDGPIERL